MSPRILSNIFNTLTGTAKRVVKNNLDNAIGRGLFVNSGAKNSDDVLRLLNRNMLNAKELGTFLKILLNDGDAAVKKAVSDIFVENPSIKTKFKNLTEKEFRDELSRLNFNDGAIEYIIKSWKDKGNRLVSPLSRKIVDFTKAKFYTGAPDSFKRMFLDGIKQPSALKRYKQAINIVTDTVRFNPFKRVSKEEAKKVSMWFVSGIDRTPKDIKNILVKEGILPLGVNVAASVLRRWVALSLLITIFEAAKETISEYAGNDYAEYASDKGFLTILAHHFVQNLTFADVKWVIPVTYFWQYVYPEIDKWGSALLSGNPSRLKRELDDTLIGLDKTQTIPKTLDQQLTEEQKSEIMMDNNGNWYLSNTNHPLKRHNGMWVVKVQDKWYKLKDIKQN